MTDIYNRFTGPSDDQGYLIALEVLIDTLPQEMLLKIKKYVDSKVYTEEVINDDTPPF